MAHQGKRMISEDLLDAIKAIKDSGVTAADLIAVAEALKDGDLQGKLTAGDNVTITDENVISATDTTYTAGSGIDITDGVISATGGGSSVELYRHEILLSMRDTTNYKCMIRFEIYNNNNTTITNDILKALLATTDLSVSGFYVNTGANKVGFVDEIKLSQNQYGWYDVEYYYADDANIQTFTSRDSATYNTITDTITRIL